MNCNMQATHEYHKSLQCILDEGTVIKILGVWISVKRYSFDYWKDVRL